MYILKTKGTAKIPDYIQIRDDNFVLVNHFKANVSKQTLEKLNYIKNVNGFAEMVDDLEYGVLKKI
jgi:hypothetical protein